MNWIMAVGLAVGIVAGGCVVFVVALAGVLWVCGKDWDHDH